MQNPVLEQKLQPYLMPNEQLLWTGKPIPMPDAKLSSDYIVVPLSLVLIAFAVFYFTPVPEPNIDAMTGLELGFVDTILSSFPKFMAVICSFGIITGNVLLYYNHLKLVNIFNLTNKALIIYGITEQRILILRDANTVQSSATTALQSLGQVFIIPAETDNLISLNIKTLPQITFTPYANQQGSIKFGNDTMVGVGNMMRTIPAHSFRQIEDASTVYKLVLKLQQV